jgi:hypothetical protein
MSLTNVAPSVDELRNAVYSDSAQSIILSHMLATSGVAVSKIDGKPVWEYACEHGHTELFVADLVRICRLASQVLGLTIDVYGVPEAESPFYSYLTLLRGAELRVPHTLVRVEKNEDSMELVRHQYITEQPLALKWDAKRESMFSKYLMILGAHLHVKEFPPGWQQDDINSKKYLLIYTFKAKAKAIPLQLPPQHMTGQFFAEIALLVQDTNYVSEEALRNAALTLTKSGKPTTSRMAVLPGTKLALQKLWETIDLTMTTDESDEDVVTPVVFNPPRLPSVIDLVSSDDEVAQAPVPKKKRSKVASVPRVKKPPPNFDVYSKKELEDAQTAIKAFPTSVKPTDMVGRYYLRGETSALPSHVLVNGKNPVPLWVFALMQQSARHDMAACGLHRINLDFERLWQSIGMPKDEVPTYAYEQSIEGYTLAVNPNEPPDVEKFSALLDKNEYTERLTWLARSKKVFKEPTFDKEGVPTWYKQHVAGRSVQRDAHLKNWAKRVLKLTNFSYHPACTDDLLFCITLILRGHDLVNTDDVREQKAAVGRVINLLNSGTATTDDEM